jgi:hypothetical protein
MKHSRPMDWKRSLAAFKKSFAKSQGWNETEAESFIRDAWAYLRGGQLVVSANGKAPANAQPVFEFRTPTGWRLPPPLRLHVWERLRPKAEVAVRSLGPRERIFALIDTQDWPKGNNKDSKLKWSLARQAAANLERHLESDELQAASDAVWQAILAAIQFGRRQLLAEIYADKETIKESMRGRLMNRKGTRAKGRKQMGLPTNKFRERIQSLVREGLKAGKDSHTMRSFVESRLFNQGLRCDGSNFVLGEAIVKAETARKWVRQALKSLTS